MGLKVESRRAWIKWQLFYLVSESQRPGLTRPCGADATALALGLRRGRRGAPGRDWLLSSLANLLQDQRRHVLV